MPFKPQYEAPTPACTETSYHYHDEGFLDWSPLEQFCLILSRRAETSYLNLSPGDFMHMGYVCRPGLQPIYQYKHVDTRMYLNIDNSGHTYRIRYSESDVITVLPDHSVANALVRLDLELLAEIRKTETHVA